MENHRVINMGSSNKMSNSPNGISTAERDQVPAVPLSESQDSPHVITSTIGQINHSSPNAIRPPLPPPHLPLPPTGLLPTTYTYVGVFYYLLHTYLVIILNTHFVQFHFGFDR